MNQPVLFVSHGGGPLPLLGDPGHAEMVEAFADIRTVLNDLPRPRAVLTISAHWEAEPLRLTAAPDPGLYYDYYGFPDESYQIQYPAPGAPDVADAAAAVLQAADIEVTLDEQRGLDHGVFVPGLLLYPEADIPTLQLSLHPSLDPAFHLRIGRALKALREQGVLIIGSGFSFHNMRAFFGPADPTVDKANRDFERWLQTTVEWPEQMQREQRMLEWADAPGARLSHPREEHLLPLHVCVAAAATPASRQWHFSVLGRQGSCYLWN